MSPARPALTQKVREALEPSTPTVNPSWLREWKGFHDFTLEANALRGPVNYADGKKDRCDCIAACDKTKAAQRQSSSSALSTPSHKEKHSPAKALLKLFQNNVSKSSASNANNPFLRTPLDIKLMVLEHLDPLDRIMMRFTCKGFYQTIPMAGAFPFPQHSCGQARLFMRLMDSSLRPWFYHDGKLLKKPQIRAILRSFLELLYCDMCQNYWFTNSVIQCPFHYQMNTELKLSLLKLIRYKVGMRAIIQHVSISEVITQEGYIDFVENAITSAPVTSFRIFKFKFVKSWIHQINKWEDSGLYYGEKGKRQIWTLHCCNHCKNVLPSNDYSLKCKHCVCEMCGWTPIRVLRVAGARDGQPRFVPLGILREGAQKNSLKMLRGPKLEDKGPASEYIF